MGKTQAQQLRRLIGFTFKRHPSINWPEDRLAATQQQLAAYLTRWLTPETLSLGAMNGHFFETFVVAELLKSYTNAGKEEDFYFLRDSNDREIDVLIFQNNTLFPTEIKQHTSPTPKDIKNFSMLDSIKNINIGEGGVLCLSQELLPLTDKHKIIPMWAV